MNIKYITKHDGSECKYLIMLIITIQHYIKVQYCILCLVHTKILFLVIFILWILSLIILFSCMHSTFKTFFCVYHYHIILFDCSSSGTRKLFFISSFLLFPTSPRNLNPFFGRGTKDQNPSGQKSNSRLLFNDRIIYSGLL